MCASVSNRYATAHLPECEYGKLITYTEGGADVEETCICQALRACEQRITQVAYERGYDQAIRDNR